MSIKTILLSAFLFLIFFSPSITAQTTYHVKPSGNDTNDGLSWNTAFVTLQKAIDAAAANDQIWVAEGTYLPSKESDGTTDSQRDFTFYMDFDVEIYGGFPNTGTPTLNDRNWENHPTILSADFNADDVPISDKDHADFPAQNNGENARTIVHTKNVSSNFVVDGFFMEGGNADVSGSFSNPNTNGGAWFNDGSGNGNSSNPKIQNCSFHNNQANRGGALYNFGVSGESSPILTNCSFHNNQANGDGGALLNDGWTGESSPTLTNCSFHNNQANINGGALYNLGRSGGESSPIITNCIFWQNTGNGKTMYNNNATPQLSYTLVEESDCSFEGEGTNNVSCGAGMVYAQDPMFTDPANGDLSLKEGSPAIDMGLNSENNEPQDLAGNPRTVDATGTGSGNIDLGAYEYQKCPTSGNIVYVNKSASGSDNGKSWADAFNDLQDAISIAKSCSNVTQIWVAEGTYLPSKESDGTTDSQKDFTFYMDFDVEIYGGFPNTGTPTLNDRNWENHPTILSGDFNADDVPISDKDHADFPAQNNGENARTIVHTKNVSSNFVVDGFFMEGGNADGSGVFTVPNSGGAWYNDGSGNGNSSNPKIQNCSFYNNQANRGGALYNFGRSGESSPTLTNCSFYNNHAFFGGALYNDGWNGESSPTLTNCSFHNNQADFRGGAVFNFGGSNSESSPILTNCSFYNNQADFNGGALYNLGVQGTSSPIITNCIFWQNTGNGKTMYNDSATPQLSYTLVEESDCSFEGEGTNNVSCSAGMVYAEDPLFKDAANGDLSLKQCSPAIDMGLNSANNELQDLAGNTRMVDATGSDNIDLGAYEYQSTYTICSACLTSGNIVYVNKSASGSDNGKSWADAFNDLQDAISIAKSCSNVTQIWVAEGTYLPSKESDGTTDSQRDFTFYMDFDVEIYGGFPNTGIPTLNDRNWENHPTILSADFDGDDVPISDKDHADFPAQNNGENARTIVHTKNVSSNFVVDGFFMEGGNADVSGNSNPNTNGGAWYNDGSGNGNSSNPKIQNCRFHNNQADFGGALLNDGESGESSPTLTNCSFYNNQADFSGGALYNLGRSGESSPTLTNCSFYNNQADFSGGALYNLGRSGESSPTLTNCSFHNNQADFSGGALFNDGAIGESSPTLTNCSFYNNQANNDGGALFNLGVQGTSSPIITNCIFWQNTGNGKTMYNFEATPQLSYTLVEESDCSFVGSNGSSVSCGAGMIYAQDPMFKDAANGDLSLKQCSPAINTGDGNTSNSTNTETEDIVGNPRFYEGGIIDMGAYEYQGIPFKAPFISGDLEYCNGGQTILDAGNGANYLWSNNETTQTIEATAGTYTVTITNQEGCIGTDQVSVTENSPAIASITGDLEYCAADNTTTLDAGTWSIYAWSNSETSQTIEANEGTYTITVTDSNGCINIAEAAVTENANLIPSITGDLEYCASENTTTLDAGTWSIYAWSNDENTQTIEVGEGTYTVTVTDNSGCTGTDQVSVTENANLIPSITGDLEYCASENTTTLDAGTWSIYAWSNDENTQTIEVGEGTYTVTVTDNSGCTGTDQVSVTENANPIPSITGDLEYCRGRTAFLDAGEYEEYQWSNGETNQSFSTTAIGVYTLTVTNQEGCTGTAMAEISMTPCLAEAGILTANAATICAGGNVEVSTTGEQTDTNYSQYFFIYTQNNLGTSILHDSMIADYEEGEASAAFSGLMAGDYLVCAYNECQSCLPNPSPITMDLDDIYDTGSIQDGCFDIECTTINIPEAFEPNVAGSGATAPTGTGMNLFIAEVCGGTAPYSEDFTSLGGFASVQEYPSENTGCVNYQITYGSGVDWTLTVMDSNGCSNESAVFTNDGLEGNPLPQIIEPVISPETCVGDEDGSIGIVIEGGDDDCGEYTYTWSGLNDFSETVLDDTTGSTIEDLASGFYDVTVTDCAGTTTVMQDIYVGRTNGGSGRGRGRSGGCKTAGNNDFNDMTSLRAYPNPFSQITSIEFSIAETSKVWIAIYSIEGRKVAEILKGESIEGNTPQQLAFDAEKLQSGAYILELQTESGLSQHQQLMVVK